MGNVSLASFNAGFVRCAESLDWPNWFRSFTPLTVVSACAQRLQNLNRSDLWRYSGPSAVLAVLLTFTLLMAYNRLDSAKTLGSSALPVANPPVVNAIEQRPLIPKPLPGKPAPSAKTGSGSPKPVTSTQTVLDTTPRRLRVKADDVDYLSDDVTVRTFTGQPAATGKEEPNIRIVHIGDDVTVRRLAPQTAKAATH